MRATLTTSLTFLLALCSQNEFSSGFGLIPQHAMKLSPPPQNSVSTYNKKTFLTMSSSSMTSEKTTKKITLTKDTTWRLSFVLSPNSKVSKTAQLKEKMFISTKVLFLEDEGYEPPQGLVVSATVEEESNDEENIDEGDNTQSSSAPTSQIVKVNNQTSRWKLSEDPDEEQKWGLWIWGLLEEPQYPFLLLNLDIESLQLPGMEQPIGPLKLYAKIPHKREKETGNVLLSAAPLNFRESLQIKADPLGAATVNINEDLEIGQINLQPIVN